jgi:hypothetical protein
MRAVGQYHGRLGREELEREVIGAIGQGVDLIRDPLHHGGVLFPERDSGGARGAESWRRMMEL